MRRRRDRPRRLPARRPCWEATSKAALPSRPTSPLYRSRRQRPPNGRGRSPPFMRLYAGGQELSERRGCGGRRPGALETRGTGEQRLSGSRSPRGEEGSTTVTGVDLGSDDPTGRSTGAGRSAAAGGTLASCRRKGGERTRSGRRVDQLGDDIDEAVRSACTPGRTARPAQLGGVIAYRMVCRGPAKASGGWRQVRRGGGVRSNGSPATARSRGKVVPRPGRCARSGCRPSPPSAPGTGPGPGRCPAPRTARPPGGRRA